MTAKKEKVNIVKPTGAVADFNMKLSKDMIALLKRSIDIMIIEIGAQETINLVLSVVAFAGVVTAKGANGGLGTFQQYVSLAERKIYGKDAP